MGIFGRFQQLFQPDAAGSLPGQGSRFAVVSPTGELIPPKRSTVEPAPQSPADLNGRWAVEEPWYGDECDWWIPGVEADGVTELTFATKAEANSYMYARKLEDRCRVVQISRWTFPKA